MEGRGEGVRFGEAGACFHSAMCFGRSLEEGGAG